MVTLCHLVAETSANRKQVENMAKKKLDNLLKESKIRDREDPDSFTIAALPPAGKPADQSGSQLQDAVPHIFESNCRSKEIWGRPREGSYRHVYLEGMEEASIFVHVAVNDITGKARAATGIKGLFHRNPKQGSLDSHAAAQRSRKHPFGAHLLRRTASAPTKGQQPKVKKGFPEIAIETKDYNSEGAGEERESEVRLKASAAAAASHQPTPPQDRNGESPASHQAKGPWERPDTNGAIRPEEGKGKRPLLARRSPASEPLKRASRLGGREPPDAKPGAFARVALSSSGRVGMSSNCIACVIGHKESPEAERKAQLRVSRACEYTVGVGGKAPEKPERRPLATQSESAAPSPPRPEASPEALPLPPVPFPRTKARQTLGAQHIRLRPVAPQSGSRSCSVPRRRSANTVAPSLDPDCRTGLRWQRAATPPNYGAVCGQTSVGRAHGGLSLSSSSDGSGSLSSLELPPPPPPRSVLDGRKKAVGTLQREMNALFAQKMEELRHKSPMFFAGKVPGSVSGNTCSSRLPVDFQ
ncbi:1-phosphatidylinositol 4,5-bisphosphate phosphodiesterase eta-2 [Liparis tanakae]|uniref:1-phosphatidylinositol 4,5-bisphosphate phosphodiesterase eta-2 n=1 Tax=Liparis tanakae TaxID=230148 RepID=A0A4Z2G1Y7_9TELE|nr:1-phosphatidylinositol 4,5-bisphosphate phosphodiesterase eta-2 [Liparis tanakae]